VKFWQMIGRGTRLCKNLFGYQDHKKEFLILDFCQNFEFFSENPKGTETERPQTLNEKLFNFKLRLSQILLEQKRRKKKIRNRVFRPIASASCFVIYTRKE
jgi:type I restriction enzyme R subunit